LLSNKEKELINDFITKNGSFKLTDVCDFLIDNGSSKETYSSGKFKLYPLIGVYLKTFVINSLLEMIHIENNVHYTKIGTISFDSKLEFGIDKKQQTDIGQLSLF
jgi:hypothetical protein